MISVFHTLNNDLNIFFSFSIFFFIPVKQDQLAFAINQHFVLLNGNSLNPIYTQIYNNHLTNMHESQNSDT